MTRAVTGDPRWRLEDELMCQVFGFSLFGFLLGFGRVVCFMEVEDIQALAAKTLSNLGIGPQYAAGMMSAAHDEFRREGNTSLYARLVGVGHANFLESRTAQDFAEAVFDNTQTIQRHTSR